MKQAVLFPLCTYIAVASAQFAGAIHAADPPALPEAKSAGDGVTTAEVSALVEQLGSDDFTLRENASEKLAAVGLPAKSALLAGLKHSDPEVKRRCRLLLADVLEQDYKLQLKNFIDDKTNQQTHDLPGWKYFQKRIGSDKEARELFIQIQQAEPGLIASAETDDFAAEAALKMRFFQVYSDISNRDRNLRKNPSVGTIAALLFVSTDERIKLPEKLISYSYWPQVIFSTNFRNMLGQTKNAKRNTAALKLLGHWIERPSKINLLIQKLRYAVQYKLPAGLTAALKAIEDDPNLAPGYKSYALMTIGQIGGKPYMAKLNEYLDDRGLCGTRVLNEKRMEIQIRDVCLAWLIHLTGQDHNAYGQPNAKTTFDRLKRSPSSYLSPSYFYFSSEQAREKAFEKWKKWVAENPLPELPKGVKKRQQAPAVPAKNAANNNAAPGNLLAQNKVEESKEEEEEERPLDPLEVDRTQSTMLAQAQGMIDNQRFTDAARVLGSILESEIDGTIQPDEEVRVFRDLKLEAERMLSSGPPSLRQSFELLFGAKAKQLLEKNEVGDLEQIVRQYFHTNSGPKALHRLAVIEQDRSNIHRAIWCWQRLRSSGRNLSALEPMLTIQLATAFLKAGNREEARDVVDELNKNAGTVRVTIAGVEQQVVSEGEIHITDDLSTAQPESKDTSWKMLRGDAARNRKADVATPYLKGQLLAKTSDVPRINQWISELTEEQHNQRRIIIPSSLPLVIGDTVIVRMLTELRAIDLRTGKLRWRTQFDDTLRDLVTKNQEAILSNEKFVRRALQSRLWRDATYGALSSDGERVYCVAGLAFGPGTDISRFEVTRDGKRRLDPAWLKRYNRISAIDIKTGKLVWEVGGSKVSDLPYAGAMFRGVPLPFAGRLYAAATFSSRTRLYEISPTDGLPRREIALTVPGRTVTLSMTSFLPFLIMQGSAYRSGISPSSHAGVLVCPANNGRWVGVDLLSMSVRWYYDVTKRTFTGGRSMPGYWEEKISDASRRDPGRYWVDSMATIAEGRAILQSGVNSRVVCVDLLTGEEKWSVKRGADIYIGGVVDGTVVTVGRDGVRGLQLANGEAAWELIRHPEGAVPSGRGLLSQGHYFVPLSNGHIACIDVLKGKQVSRSRAVDGIVPGNLIPLPDGMLSMSADGLWKLPTLKSQIETFAARLKTQMDNAGTLTDMGTALLSNGQYDLAIAKLQEADELKSTQRSRQLLLSALIESAAEDEDVSKESTVALLGKLESLVDDANQQIRLLHDLAAVYESAEQKRSLFKTLLRLVELDKQRSGLTPVTSSRSARRDLRIQVRLEKLWNDEDEALRTEINRQIEVLSVVSDPAEFLALFGRHPSADSVRIEWAKGLTKAENWGHAESLYRQVLKSKDESFRNEAKARLAEVIVASKAKDVGGALFHHLKHENGSSVLVDSKTGNELLSELNVDVDKFSARLNPKWPAIVKASENNARRSVPYSYPSIVSHDNAPFGNNLQFNVDSSGRSLTAYDEVGAERLKLTLPQLTGPRTYYGMMYSFTETHTRGNYLLVWLGNRICAFDTLDDKPKLLWNKPTQEPNTLFPQIIRVPPMRLRTPRKPNGRPASQPSHVHLTADAACYQREKRLICLDPITGKTRWERDDFPRDGDLIGDDETMIVTIDNEDENIGKGFFVRLLDGYIEHRKDLPPLSARVIAQGRNLLTWDKESETPTLVFQDLVSDEVHWKQTFSKSAKLWLVNRDEVAIMETDGSFKILRVSDGSTLVENNLKLGGDVLDIIVKKHQSQYILIANQSTKATEGTVMPIPGCVRANGQVSAFAHEGKQLWTYRVENQGFKIEQPSHIPVLTFMTQYQIIDGRSRRYGFRLLCLDKRSGMVLHESDSKYTNNVLWVEGMPERKAVEVRTRSKTVRFDYSDEDS